MKVFEGIVTSVGMNKTVVVEVTRRTPHPLYKKLIKRSKKYKADNAEFENVGLGSRVRIVETKPISKDKYFKISQILVGFAAPVKKDETASEATESVEEPKRVRKTVKSTVAKAKADKKEEKKLT